MGRISDSPQTIRFGNCECDLRSGELYKNGRKVRLADQPLRLLTALIERHGELVTRQELEARLWPGQSFGDFNDGLNTAINKLRGALGDKAEDPRYIETIPRRGYRFIASVETNGAGNDSAAAAPVLPPAVAMEAVEAGDEPAEIVPRPMAEVAAGSRESHGRAKSPRLRQATMGLAAALFAVWWCTPLPPPRINGIDQVTFEAQIDTPVKPAFEGKRVYYIARRGDHWDLMQTSLGQGDGQPLPAPADSALVMDASPASSQLLLGSFSKRGEEDRLWTTPAPGAIATRLGNITADAAAFSPEGERIAYIHGGSLWIVNADGANARKLVDLTAPASWLAWSPDGQRLRFTLGPLFSAVATSIWEVSSDGRDLHPVLTGRNLPNSACCGSWTADGRYYIFTASRAGRENLWALRERGSLWRRSPRGPFQLTSGPDTPFGGTPSRDGHHIYFYNGVWREELERLDLGTAQFLPLATGERAMHVSFSRDGQWIAFLDTQSHGLFRSRPDGLTERVELAAPNLNPAFPRWSPDGKWLAFSGLTAGHPGQVFVVAADGGEPQPLLRTEADERDADWSADGRQLVLAHSPVLRDRDVHELLLVDFATRHTEKIPASDRLAMTRWSPDGRYISATTDDQSQLKLWNVSTRRWLVVAKGTALGISVWSPDSRYLYFQDILGAGERLRRYDVARDRIEPVEDFSEILKSGVDRCALFSVAPDGSPIVGFNRAFYDLYSAATNFP